MRFKPIQIYLIFLVLIFFSGGCATIGGLGPVRKMAINGVVPSIEDIFDDMLCSEDMTNAASLCQTVLPLMDSFVEFTPDNKKLLTITAKAYALYSFAFVEDEDPERAIKLYTKGKEYGLRALRQNKAFDKALANGEKYVEAVKHLKKDEVDTVFYTGLGWAFGAMLKVKGGDLSGACELPKVRALMDRAIELDETYFHGGPHLFYGAYYGVMPAMLGGGPDKAKASFDKAFGISDKFLPTHLFYAQYYATITMNEELFDKEIQYVLKTPADILPDMTLAAAAAKKKARALLENKGNYF